MMIKNAEKINDRLVCTACERGHFYKSNMEREDFTEWPEHLKFGSKEYNGCPNCGGFGWVARQFTCPSGERYWMSNSICGMTIYDGKRIKSMDGKELIYKRGFMTKSFFDEMGFDDPFEE